MSDPAADEPIVVNSDSWTGEIEGPSSAEFRDAMRSAPPQAKVAFLSGMLGGAARSRLRTDICCLVIGAAMLAIYGAVRLLMAIPIAYVRAGLSIAVGLAVVAGLLLLAAALAVRWLWAYLNRSCTAADADNRRRWQELRGGRP